MDSFIGEYIESYPDFTTSDFTNMMKLHSPGVGRSTIYATLKELCDHQLITRTGRGSYKAEKKRTYAFDLSDTAQKASELITVKYPLVDFQVWELYQLNEFVNHLLAKDIIFIDVENMLEESVFELLFDTYPHVLYLPSADDYYRYASEETIVIGKLITESPPCFGIHKQAALDKILVDLFAHGITGQIVSRSEYPAIYEDSFEKYSINQARMFRYARRRGIESEIRSFIQEETEITLEG